MSMARSSRLARAAEAQKEARLSCSRPHLQDFVLRNLPKGWLRTSPLSTAMGDRRSGQTLNWQKPTSYGLDKRRRLGRTS